ncbi:MAG: choice-of-anchor J domain-containing protein [Prevotellaceae bacterium]|nr:choice-of-anchor J domain-containing protein [Prevotellaceae bacterium]
MNVGGTSAQLTWLGTAPQWEVKVTTTSTTTPDAITSAVIDTTVNSLPVSLTGLSPLTTYYVYIRPNCTSAGNGVGNWSNTSFQTGCLDITTLPYEEDFEHYGTGSSAFPTCWTRVQSYSGYPYVNTVNYNHTTNNTTPGALYFYCYGSTRNITATQRIDVPGKRLQDLRLTFFMYTTYASYGMCVGVMDDLTDPASFVPVDTFMSQAANEWQECIVDFTNYTGTGTYIAFSDNHTTSSNLVYIDDIRLEVIPTCDRPRTINISTVSENAISCSWTQGVSGETQWQAVIGPRGFNPDSTAISRQIINNVASCSFTSLTPATNYEIYVRGICTPGDTSAWSYAKSVTTTNAVESLPLYTDFNDAADNAHWSTVGTPINDWYIGNATGCGDNTSLYISEDNGVTNGYSITSTSYAYATRTFRFTPGHYTVSYNWKGNGQASNDYMRVCLAPTSDILSENSANGITTLPYTEDFENYGTDTTAFPTCWTKVSNYGSYPYVSTTAYNHTPNATNTYGSLYIYGYQMQRNVIATQRINVPGHTIQEMRVTFYFVSTNAASGLCVGVMEDLNDISTFTPIDTIYTVQTSTTSSPYWHEVIVNFDQYVGNGNYIVFTDNHTASTNYLYLDDVCLDFIPSCDRPTDVHVTNVTETQIDVAWSPGVGTQGTYQAVIGPQGFDPDSNATSVLTVSTTTATFTGLPSSSPFDVYVRAICQPGDTSRWSNACATRTTNVPENLPLSTNFSNATDNAKWATIGAPSNNWYCGTADGNGDNTAMYISGDQGANNTYVINAQSYAYTYRTLRFTPGLYTISFDWKCYGEGNFDYMRVYLIPASVNLAANTNNGIVTSGTPDTTWIALDNNVKLNLQSTWTTQNNQIYFADTTIYNIVFYWKNDASIGTAPSATIDNLYVGMETCHRPEPNISAKDNMMVFSPTCADSIQIGYELCFDTTQIDVTNTSSAMHHTILAPGASDTITGLTRNTMYYAALRTICSAGDTSAWAYFTPSTACMVIAQSDLPYAIDFEAENCSGTSCIPTCWTRMQSTSYPYIISNPTAAYSGTHYLYFYSYSTSTLAMIATPYIDVPDITRYGVEFYMRYSTAGKNIVVGLCNDPSDPSTFVPVDTVYNTTANIWEKKFVHLHNYTGNVTGKNYIVFFSDPSIGTTSNYIFLDDIVIKDDRLCAQPTGLSVSNLTTTGGQLNWSSDNGIYYDVLITTSPVDPDTITGNESEVLIYEQQVTDNYVDLAGYLSVNTTYYCYVQADCQSSDNLLSLWSEEYSFTTSCPAQPVPYTQGFDVNNLAVADMPTCWTSLYERNGTTPEPSSTYPYAPYCQSATYYNVDTANNDTSALRIFAYYSTGGSSKGVAILPQLSGNLNNYKLNFVHGVTSSQALVFLVGVVTDPGDLSSFVTIDTVRSTNVWTPYSLRLDTYTGGYTNAYLAIMADGDLNSLTHNLYIDDLSVDSCVACTTPSNLAVTNVNGGEADIMLNTLHASDSLVHIQVTTVNTGLDVESIDSLAAGNFAVDTVINVNALPLHVSGLKGRTNYYVYARVQCGPNSYTNRYARPIVFKTGCTPMSIPFSEGMTDLVLKEGSTTYTQPACWTVGRSDGSATYPYVITTSHSTPNSLYLYTGTNMTTYAVMPELDVDSLQGLYLTFYVKKTSTTAGYGEIRLGVVENPDSISSFDTLATFEPSTTDWTKYTYDFSNYTGTKRYIAFQNGRAAGYSYIYLDDIYLEPTPTCFRIDVTNCTNSTENSLSFSWTAAQSTDSAWEYVLVPAGADPNTATNIVRTTSNTCTVYNLPPSTNYEFYVRTYCSSTDQSQWSAALSARTANIPEDLPLATNFSDATDNAKWALANGNEANKFCIGSAVANSGTQSLYISSSNGTSHTYSGSICHTYAYRTLRFLPGSYTISFDWLCNGEEDYDGGKAYLAPSSVTPTAGQYYDTYDDIYEDPDGWINLAGANEVLWTSTTWQHVNYAFNTTDTVVKQLVFMWRNDGSDQYDPPLAIDNVVVQERRCYVDGASTSGCSASEIIVSSVSTDATSLEAIISESALTTAQLDTMTATPFTSTVIFNGLNAQTTYNIYIRGFCASGDTTLWYNTTGTTLCADILVNDTTNYVENFDTYGYGSTLFKPSCWTSVYSAGTAYPYLTGSQSYSSPASMYFYSYGSAYSYMASPAVTGTPINNVKVNFKMYTTATTYTMQVGVMSNPNDISTFELVEEVSVSAVLTWNDISVNLTSYTGTGRCICIMSPICGTGHYTFIDNVVFSVVDSCTYPGINVDASVSYDDVTVNIIPAHATDSIFDVVVVPVGSTPSYASPEYSGTVIVPNNSINITTLAANTSYTVWARSWCGNDSSNLSAWHSTTFKTGCPNVVIDSVHSYAQNFDSDGTGTTAKPSCWTTSSTYSISYPYINATYYSSSPASLYFYNPASYVTYAVTPLLSGIPVNQMEMTLEYRLGTTTATVLQVGVMTDPEDLSTFTPVDTIDNTNSSYGSFSPINILFNRYTGNGQYIAFVAQDYVTGYIDNVNIHMIPSCVRPSIALGTSVADTLSFSIVPAFDTDSLWEVVVNKNNTLPDTTNAVYNAVVSNTNIVVTGVTASNVYNIWARTVCADGASAWTMVSCRAACGDVLIDQTHNFVENFDSDGAGSTANHPSCWSSVTNYPTAYPYITSTQKVSGIGSVYFYGSASYYCFLATPKLVGSTVNLMQATYNLYFGSTNYFAAVGVATNPTDVSTITIIDTIVPAATGWNSYTVNFENYRGNGQYIVFLAPSPQQMTSPTSTSYTYFYLDDVNISLRHYSGTKNINTTVCDGYNYVANGFNISSTELDITQSPMTFQRIVNDTLVTLTLNIVSSAQTVINDTVCQGVTYTLNGFNESTSGTYYRYLNTVDGCDSIVTLNLTVLPGYTDTEYVTICSTQLPYTWRGQTCTASGTYTYYGATGSTATCDSVINLVLTVSNAVNVTENYAICQGNSYTWNGNTYTTAGSYTWQGTTASGCDSIVTLNLTVNPTYNTTETQTITSNDLPYTWNGQTITAAGTYTYRGTTAAGCDSVVTLILTVNVGIDYAEDGMFAISPNPVKRGGEVRLDVTLNEADRDGLVIELFTSNGELIDRTEPKEQPMFVKMPDVDGLYMIRLTTGTGRVMYGKVIVK